MTSVAFAMLNYAKTRAWFRSLVDCPPGRCRTGYGLLEAWWTGNKDCNHATCVGATGCVLDYHRCCQDVDRVLHGLVLSGYLEPATRSQPLPGHTTKASGPDISRIRANIKWADRIHEPAYIYGFDPTAKLIEYLEKTEKE